MPTKKKATSRKELIAPKGDKRYVRRKSDGTFGKTVALFNNWLRLLEPKDVLEKVVGTNTTAANFASVGEAFGTIT